MTQEIDDSMAMMANAADAEEPTDLLYDPVQLKDMMKGDLNALASVVAPEDVTLQFPDFYTWLWLQLLTALGATRDFSKFALGLPRGHAKTFVIKLLICYIVLFTKRRYVLVIGANLAKAEAIISDVCAMLQHPNVVSLFGNFTSSLTKDRQEIKKFTFNGRKIILEAAGQGTAIRGSNQDNARPDVMIFDDAQTRESAASIIESDNFARWFTGTALKARSPFGCTYIYIGNMYKDLELEPGTGRMACMLRNLQRSPNWLSFIVGAILEDGTALWEELHPIEQILKDYQDDCLLGQEEEFYAEILNDPQGKANHTFDATKVRIWQPEEHLIHQGNFIVIDPATSKATPDQVVIAYHEMYDGVPVCKDIAVGKFTGPETVNVTLDMAIKHGCTLIVPESTAYQYTLCQWISLALEQRGLTGITVEPYPAHRGTKNSRIIKWMQSYMKQEYMATPDITAMLNSQARAFNPLKTTNVDDIIDTGAMAVNVGLTMQHLMTIQHGTGNVILGMTYDSWADRLTDPADLQGCSF